MLRHVNIATAYFIITYTYLYDTPEKNLRKLLGVATPRATPRLRNAVVSIKAIVLAKPIFETTGSTTFACFFIRFFFCRICKADVKLISYCFKCKKKFCQSNINV